MEWVAREVLLAYPIFSEKDAPFEIYTYASTFQLGVVITQKGKPIAHCSRKLTITQLNYTTTECELLAIVETSKEFHNILLGQKMVACADHKNLVHKVFNTAHAMPWHLTLEAGRPDLQYLKGNKNIVADALSCLQLVPPA